MRRMRRWGIKGYKPDRGNASRLAANDSIKTVWPKSKGALKAEATVERVLKELSGIGFSDLRRVFDANGRLLRPEERDVSRRGRFGRSGDPQHRRQ